MKTERKYSIKFLDEDKKAFELVEKINDYLDIKYNNAHGKYGVLFDISDVDENTYYCFVEFNDYNADAEFRVQDWIVECAKDMGVEVKFEDYPNIDEYSYLSYSYSATFTL